MHQQNQFKHSNFAEVFGELQSVHRKKRYFGNSTSVPLILVVGLILGSIIFYETGDPWTIPVCVAPPLMFIFAVVWNLFISKNDELRIYEFGFTYKNSQKLHACRWDEIAKIHFMDLTNREPVDVSNARETIYSVEKIDSDEIVFATGLAGREHIKTWYDDFLSANDQQ